jgi:hypothetical protein
MTECQLALRKAFRFASQPSDPTSEPPQTCFNQIQVYLNVGTSGYRNAVLEHQVTTTAELDMEMGRVMGKMRLSML